MRDEGGKGRKIFVINVSFGNLGTREASVLPPLQGGLFFKCHLGLKPQAESLSPFGTQFDRLLRDRIRARIHIGQQIVSRWLRSDLGFLHGTLNFVINSCFDPFELSLIDVTVR
jgi:hypothetical protein